MFLQNLGRLDQTLQANEVVLRWCDGRHNLRAIQCNPRLETVVL